MICVCSCKLTKPGTAFWHRGQLTLNDPDHTVKLFYLYNRVSACKLVIVNCCGPMLTLEPCVAIAWERALSRILWTEAVLGTCNSWCVQVIEFQFVLAMVSWYTCNQEVQFDSTKWPLVTPTSLYFFLSPCHNVWYTVLTAVCVPFGSGLKKKCIGQFFSWINSLFYFIIWPHAQTELLCIEEQDGTLQALKRVAKHRLASAISRNILQC